MIKKLSIMYTLELCIGTYLLLHHACMFTFHSMANNSLKQEN